MLAEIQQNIFSVHQVYRCIMEAFAGPAMYGAHSASVQKTLHEAETMALERIPQVYVLLKNSYTLYIQYST